MCTTPIASEHGVLVIATARKIASTIPANLELAGLAALHVELVPNVTNIAFCSGDGYGTEIARGAGGRT
jgi:hypothetical protein